MNKLLKRKKSKAFLSMLEKMFVHFPVQTYNRLPDNYYLTGRNRVTDVVRFIFKGKLKNKCIGFDLRRIATNWRTLGRDHIILVIHLEPDDPLHILGKIRHFQFERIPDSGYLFLVDPDLTHI